MVDRIQDTNFAAGPRGEVDAIPTVPTWEVEERAQEVVDAAVRARQKEIVQDPSSTYDPETGEERINYMDMATGELYVYLGDNRWMKAATGQAVGDPRDIDPEQYRWVLDRFRYFHERWPSAPAAMAVECENAKVAIQSGQVGSLLTADQIVWNGWGGDAQRHFTQYFMDPFVQTAVTNQQWVLDELAVAMYCYEGLLKQAAVDAKSAADNTIKVLDGLYESNPPDAATTIQIAKTVVGIVGAVAAAAAAPVTGGTSLVLAVGLVAAGLDGGMAIVMGIEEQQKERSIHGGTVDEVLEKLRGTLDDLKQDMDQIEQNLATQVGHAADRVDDWLGSGDPLTVASILPNEPDEDGVPNLTEGEVVPGADDFRPRH